MPIRMSCGYSANQFRAGDGCQVRTTVLCRGFGWAATFADFSGARSRSAAGRARAAAKFILVMSGIDSGLPLNGLGIPICCEVRNGALSSSPSSPNQISSPVSTAPTTIKYATIGIRIEDLQPEVQREGTGYVPVLTLKRAVEKESHALVPFRKIGFQRRRPWPG